MAKGNAVQPESNFKDTSRLLGTCLAVQWLGHHVSSAGSTGSILLGEQRSPMPPSVPKVKNIILQTLKCLRIFVGKLKEAGNNVHP